MQGRKADNPAGRRLAALLGACLAALVLGACGGGGLETTAGDDVAPVTDPTTATEPETEDTTAPEDPDDPGGTDAQDVAVELPGLPIGGGPTSSTETVQCVDVGWTTPPDLPDWIGVTVTGIAFEPEDGFALSDESCDGGTPPCLDGEVQITGTQRCYVAVTWTDSTLQDQGKLWFTGGLVSCPAERADECEAFRAEVEAAGPQSVPLDPPPVGVEDGG